MGEIYYMLSTALYAAIVIFTGFYIAYIIDRHHNNLNRFQRARESIIKDLTKIAEHIEETNELLAKRRGLILDYKKRCK